MVNEENVLDQEVLSTEAQAVTGQEQEAGGEAPPLEGQLLEAPPLETPPLETPPLDAEEQARQIFFAAQNLVFIAPDVPPAPVRSRRSEGQFLRELEDEGFESADQQRRRQRRKPQERAEAQSEPQQESRKQPQEPQKVKGSTRLEAKKLRRREGRDLGRKRIIITESEFLARRESVDRTMVVRTLADRIQIGVLEDNVLVEHYVARSREESLIGNVYLGKVQNVLPSMEAAFVDIGRGRNAVLYSGEVDWSEFEGSNQARKIESALKPGDRVLVQVTKDPVGHKGARLTSQVSLPGRFLVYVPGGAMNGISRKLPDTERARLKKILKEVLPDGAGVIVRTAAEGASEEHLKQDVQRLTKQWEAITAHTKKGNAPELLHSESDMLIKIVRDVFNEDFGRMVVSGAETHKTIVDYLTQVAPELVDRIEKSEPNVDVFDEYRINEQIAKALDRKVWLPSGGSLVIDRTEAMTVVDVNTGKFVGSGGNLEETVTKNNLEAAEEIVRQLRLRDIGGIIVIDFIDMVLESNRELVLRRVVECLGRDRTKHQVAEVTSLGLVQMTRKKLGLGLLESFSDPCEVCAGRGVIVQHDMQHREAHGSKNGHKRSNGQAGQAHAITDGAKNMIAKVAASTITKVAAAADGIAEEAEGAVTEGAVAEVAVAEVAVAEVATKEAQQAGKRQPKRRGTNKPDAVAAEAESVKAEAVVVNAPEVAAPEITAPVVTVPETATPVVTDAVVAAEAGVSKDLLLESLLDALPEAPEIGKSRLRSRRASRMQQRSLGNVETDFELDAQHAESKHLTDNK